VLGAAAGKQNQVIAAELGTHPDTVGLWRNRFRSAGLAGIEKDAPRPGRLREVPQAVVDQIVNKTLHEKPKGSTHWSTRSLAAAMGVSKNTVQRVWKIHRLEPHRVRTFKVSRDKHFNEKLRDVVGLYMNPPEKAAVFCVDEKTQIQALDRTQTILPIRPGLPESRTHDYKRNGKTDLFAALNVLDGTVIVEFHNRHRNLEFLVFLRTIDEQVPADLDIHIVLDNLSAHKHENVKRWLARRPRIKFHFVPTSSSWLNLVERWFSELTQKQIRRGTFASVPALKRAILDFVSTYHENPRPFVWTATADDILRKVAKNRHLLGTAH
ncbi:MAG: IS630 family transposase, partial [bacterium]